MAEPADPELCVRPAEPADVAVIARLLSDFNREFGEPTPPVDVLRPRIGRLLAAGDTVVLLAGSDPAGLAVLRFRAGIWSENLECHLAELYVRPDRRGRGIGRRLMQAALSEARHRGADQLDLATGEDDVAARALYESLGFSNREGGPDGPVTYFYALDL